MMKRNQFFLIVLGFIITFLILYNRLIKIRLPKNFYDLHIVFIVSIIITLFVLLCLNIIMFYKNIISEKKESNFANFIKKLQEHPYNPIKLFTNSLREFDIFLKNNMPYYNETDSYSDFIITKITTKIFNNKKKIIVVIVIFRILPQSIVCFSFIYDILTSNNFMYFYKSLWLLIFPVIITYIVYSIKTLLETDLNQLNRILSLKIINKNLLSTENWISVNVHEWQHLLLNPEGKNYICLNDLSEETKEDFGADIISANYALQYAINLMNNCFHISHMIAFYDLYKPKLETLFNIIRYLIFLLGWLNILLLKI